MDFVGCRLTATGPNLRMGYFAKKKVFDDNYYSYQLTGHLGNNMGTPQPSKENDFFQSLASKVATNTVKMPFPVSYSMPDYAKKRFENHKRPLNNNRNSLFSEETDNNWENMKNIYTDGIVTKGLANFSSKIFSHIVGGFVGSKSQMNNEKYKLSLNLGAIVVDLLNESVWEKAAEKNSCENNTEAPKYTTEIIKKPMEDKTSHSVDAVDSVDNSVNFAKSIPEDEIYEKVEPQSCDVEYSSVNSFLNYPNFVNCSAQETKENDQLEEIPVLGCNSLTTPRCSISNTTNETCSSPANQNENVKNHVTIDSCKTNLSTESTDAGICSLFTCSLSNSPGESNNILAEESMNCADILLNNILNYKNFCSQKPRSYKQSESSIDSTDSDSFVIFEECNYSPVQSQDEGCLRFFLDFDEYTDDNDDFDASSIDTYFEYIGEANQKWTENYGSVHTSSEACSNKKVNFSDKVDVHWMIKWDYAYRAARLGPWEQMARDRARFQDRIRQLDSTISPILQIEHREKIFSKLYS